MVDTVCRIKMTAIPNFIPCDFLYTQKTRNGIHFSLPVVKYEGCIGFLFRSVILQVTSFLWFPVFM